MMLKSSPVQALKSTVCICDIQENKMTDGETASNVETQYFASLPPNDEHLLLNNKFTKL
jgi:hypothetical protein